MSWEKDLILSLNNLNNIEKDNHNTSFFKCDLALVDSGNLVNGTLVSNEFWKLIGGKMLESSNAHVGTAKKGWKR